MLKVQCCFENHYAIKNQHIKRKSEIMFSIYAHNKTEAHIRSGCNKDYANN